MKRFRSIALIALAAMMLVAFTACSGGDIDWDSLKRDDVVAEYNGVQLTKRMVSFQYSIEDATSAYTQQFYSQLGGEGTYDSTVYMDDCLKTMAAYTLLAGIAADQGLTITEEAARESAYDEYILSAKKYDYLQEFSDSMKKALYLSDDLLVEYGTEYDLITDSAENVIKAEFEKLDANDFEDLDAMTESVTASVKELVKGKTVSVNYPSKHTVSSSELDFDQLVSNVKWNYSSLFN